MNISLIQSVFKTLALCLSLGAMLTATQAQAQEVGKHATDYTYANGNSGDTKADSRAWFEAKERSLALWTADTTDTDLQALLGSLGGRKARLIFGTNAC
jgi:hypothetical protein